MNNLDIYQQQVTFPFIRYLTIACVIGLFIFAGLSIDPDPIADLINAIEAEEIKQ